MAQNTVAVIPARAGSKRCKGKNISLFKGKPLVAHSIEQALQADIFKEIIVTTDDQEVKEIAGNYPVRIIDRKPKMAMDKATLIDVIRELISDLNFIADTIIGLLLVTAPLRSVPDIIQAYKIFTSSDQNNAVVSVTQNEYPVELSWHRIDDHLVPLFPEKSLKTTRKQDFQPTFKYNDAVIFDLAGNFLKPDRNLFGHTPIPYVMPPERSIYIDYDFQLKLVKMLGEHSKGDSEAS